MRLNQVTLGAIDVDASIAFYGSLGLELIVRTPDYARFIVPEGQATLSVHRVPSVPREGAPVVYFESDTLDARVAALKARGVVFETDPVDQPWLWREATLRDPAGNLLCLYAAGVNRLDPPWRIR